jgi:hypothetical protein
VFNLLVNGAGWESNAGSIGIGRVLEYTAEPIASLFMPKGKLSVNRVVSLPTIFASETHYDNSQKPARIGALTKVSVGSRDYQLEYVIDSGFAPISNAALTAMARELDIDIASSIHEFTRTHWSIKDVDLFRVLFKSNQIRRERPRVFSVGEETIDESLVAVMMPFDAKFDRVQEALQTAVESTGMHAQRADDIWIHDHVIQDVVSLISRAKVVICDLTNRNPNVFYEMGIAHTLGRDVIMLAQSRADVPFDVGHIRYISYLPNREGLRLLKVEVKKRLNDLRERI